MYFRYCGLPAVLASVNAVIRYRHPVGIAHFFRDSRNKMAANYAAGAKSAVYDRFAYRE